MSTVIALAGTNNHDEQSIGLAPRGLHGYENTRDSTMAMVSEITFGAVARTVSLPMTVETYGTSSQTGLVNQLDDFYGRVPRHPAHPETTRTSQVERLAFLEMKW